MAGRLRDTGVYVHAMHPGWADTKGVRDWMPVFRALTRPIIHPRPTTFPLAPGVDDAAARAQLWDHVSTLATTVRA